MIIGEIINSGSIERYLPQDEKLFSSNNIQRNFGQAGDYVEYHIYDTNDNLLLSIDNFNNYKSSNLSNINPDGTLKEIDLNPIFDLNNLGFTNGDYIVRYNFFRKKISSDSSFSFFIKEISPDRTEIRVSNNNISNVDLESQIINLINEINDSQYFKDYLLNFGNNNQSVCINVGLDKNTNPYNVLLKLYEPLPEQFNLKDTFFIVDEIIQSKIYSIRLNEIFEENEGLKLNGPNFSIDVDNFQNNGTEYNNYNNLLSSENTTPYQQIISLLEDKGVDINVDYSDFSNFIHFSSATERIQNFYYKLQLIELYNSQSVELNNVTSSLPYQISNKSILQDKINNIISKFDGYEYYLYFESGSKTFPKSSSSKPYIVLPSSSSISLSWYSASLYSASLYDQENSDNLEYTAPAFIRDDNQNESYLLFLNMIGQHFDNLWLYLKSTNDLYKANNNLYKGISKDLISEALKSLGIKIYSSNADINLFEYLIGSTESGSYKYQVGPTGSYQTQLITASLQPLPREDQSKEVLKRIYHNLPYLLKTKGTKRGLKTLISCFGIPDTILRVFEYGGTDSESNYDLEYTKYNKITEHVFGVNWDSSSFYNNMYPKTIEGRFMVRRNFYNVENLVHIKNNDNSFNRQLILEQINDIEFNVHYVINNVSSSIYNIPIKLNEWNNFMVTNDGTTGEVFIKNQINGEINTSVSTSLADNFNDVGTFTTKLSGFSVTTSEIRFWTTILSESVFEKHVLNPESIVGNTISDPYNNLVFRGNGGTDLYSSYDLNPSFSSSNPNISYSRLYSLVRTLPISESYENYYINQIDGAFRKSTNKIRIQNNLITGSVLNPYIRLENISGSNLTQDLHFIEVSLSPTFEIDTDILNQFGGNIKFDNYIGNPDDLYKTEYSNLKTLNEEYFKKWINSKPFNYYDYIRIIKYFDNSLFKMVKDFIPAKANLLSGLVIQPHILERNKIKQFPPEFNLFDFSSSLKIGNISEDRSYIYDKLENKEVFYNGEYEGLKIDLNKQFIDNNNNPYLISESKDDTQFNHSEFNVLLNNVQNNIKSEIRQTEDINNKNILNQSEINDSDLSLTSYLKSRYEGEKTISRLYNTYTPGDKSYGKTAAIDKYTKKIALFTEIISSSFLPNRNNTVIKYLIDESGSLTELNRYNKNWEEVQRTFISDNNLIVSLFDNQKYSNQKTLDGEKSIFNSGYSYYPTLYFSSSDGYLYFSLLENSDKDFISSNKGGVMTGSSGVYYSLFTSGSKKITYTVFDNVIKNELSYYIPGLANNNYPYYIIPDIGTYQFEGSLSINANWPSSSNSASYTFEIWSGSQSGVNIIGEKIWSQDINLESDLFLKEAVGDETGSFHTSGGTDYLSNGPVKLLNPGSVVVATLAGGTTVDIEVRKVRIIVPPYGNPSLVWVYFVKYGGRFYRFNGYVNGSVTPGGIVPFGSNNTTETMTISTPSFNYFQPNDHIIFRLVQNYFRTPGIGSIVEGGELKVNLIGDINQDPYSTAPFVQPITGSNQLTFTPNISSFFNYLYLPKNSSILYDTWGDVDYPFTVNEQDIIMIQLGENNMSEHTITKLVSSGSFISVNVSPAFSIGINTVNKFLLLKRVEDETNVIFRFNKRPGNTSYGFIIPENLSSDVLNNIDTITKEVKLKLIEDGNNIGLDVDGGTY